MSADSDAKARLYHHARREAWLAGLVWLTALLWSVGYCYLFGYQHSAEDWVVQAGLAPMRRGDDLQLILGLPDWVIIGILAPWVLCTLSTIGFALFIMQDDDLGKEVEEGEDVAGKPATSRPTIPAEKGDKHA